MKCKVIATPKNPTIIGGKPVKVGDVVDVTVNELKNLARKGWVEPSDAAAKEVDLASRSILEEDARDASVEEQVEAKLAKKKADDEAKKH